MLHIKSSSKKLFVYLLLLQLVLAGPLFAATTSSDSVNVNLTIPGPPATGGGSSDQTPCTSNCPPTNPALTITNVSTNTATSTGVVSWNVSGGAGVSSVDFSYGLSTSYGTTSAVSGAYQTTLSGLSPSTTYYFKITVTDSNNATANYAGSFTTQALTTPQDTTPPQISQIVVTPSQTGVTVSWQTDEPADGQLRYGTTKSYDASTALDTTLTQSHTVSISNLVPNTTYHVQILSTDASGNTGSSSDQTFTTLRDTTPPPNVTGLTLTPSVNSVTVQWVDPSPAVVPDFGSAWVVRKVGAPAQSVSDGILIYSGVSESLVDTYFLKPSTTYYYTIFSFDTSGNRSSGVYASTVLLNPNTPPVAEICNNGIDDDKNGLADCADPVCATNQACKNNNQQPTTEICNNNIDDDLNGLTDCADPVCVGFSACAVNQTSQQNNNSNNNVPAGTVGSSQGVALTNVRFLTGNGLLSLVPVNSTVTNLAGIPTTIIVPANVLLKEPKQISLVVDEKNNNQLQLEPSNKGYRVDFSFPVVGHHTAYLLIDYGDSVQDVISFSLESLPWGNVTEGGKLLSDVAVTLYQANGGLVNTSVYGTANPFITNVNGNYGWVVPNGQYYIVATKDGYYDRTLPVFGVENNIIAPSLQLIAKPPKLLENLTSTSTVEEKVAVVSKNVIKNISAIGKRTIQTVQDVQSAVNQYTQDPEVQKVATTRVAPTVVGVTAVSTVSFATWSDLFPFLRYLFLQPLMLLGLKRRKGWGQVYNALNKLPVDLATVRLVDVKTGKIVQSRVTDSQGRYAFIAMPGVYRLQVTKNNFVFPSQLLHGLAEDGRRTDIYHGEPVTVNEQKAVITANIPLDPRGEVKVPKRLILQRVARVAQITFSWVGFLMTLVSLYIAPHWYMWALLGVHLSLLLVFRRLALPPRIKSWGIVYDAATKQPVGRTVARLFSSQFNKLVDMQVTDSKGRYFFLAGDNRYYVTYEHPQYEHYQTDPLDLSGKDTENIAFDVALRQKKEETQP